MILNLIFHQNKDLKSKEKLHKRCKMFEKFAKSKNKHDRGKHDFDTNCKQNLNMLQYLKSI